MATTSQHGRITVEGRPDTFVLHAEYGQETARKRVRKLMPGDEFTAIAPGMTAKDRWMIYARFVDHVAALGSDEVTDASFPLDHVVEVASKPDDIDYTDPQIVQRYRTDQEFQNTDLQDLIDALQEYKRSRR